MGVEAIFSQETPSFHLKIRCSHFTSRVTLDRLLDAENGLVTLSTLQKAATALGCEVRLYLV